uniref:Uncharacterized protein n=1 Tax=Arundo donax TaxID=35708 RepID=A0A0A9NNK2_ARUDO
MATSRVVQIAHYFQFSRLISQQFWLLYSGETQFPLSHIVFHCSFSHVLVWYLNTLSNHESRSTDELPASEDARL